MADTSTTDSGEGGYFDRRLWTPPTETDRRMWRRAPLQGQPRFPLGITFCRDHKWRVKGKLPMDDAGAATLLGIAVADLKEWVSKRAHGRLIGHKPKNRRKSAGNAHDKGVPRGVLTRRRFVAFLNRVWALGRGKGMSTHLRRGARNGS